MSFQLSSGRVKKDQLADLDNLVAKFLKYICKLQERASNTFLYASRNVGGLAIQKCSEEADIWTSAKGIQLLDSDDLTIRHLARIELDNTISTGLKGRNACHLKFCRVATMMDFLLFVTTLPYPIYGPECEKQ